MKTPTISSLVLILFCVLACSKETPNEKNEPAPKPKSTEETQQPSNLISLNKAKEQLDNYNQSHPLEVGSEYALRTWISIQELKAYIAYVETESEKKGIEISGIDFIHTQYNQATPGSANPNNSVYNLTLMLAPTYENGNVNVAFDPVYSQQGQPKDLKDIFDELKSDTLGEKAPPPSGGSSIANTLTTCPNTCN